MSGIQGATMKSIRPYKSSEQYLYAMKEDLAEWLKELYDLDIDVGSFLEALETGILLCRHANSITELAREFRQGYPSLIHKLQLPTCGTTCNELAQPGTFQARDNVSNFIQWCRKEMDIKEVLMFETEDLVLRKNEKNFVLCLLEVARRASRFGMRAPTLIQMEEEIEDEIREDLNLPPEETPLPKPQRKPCSFKNLDQMVQCLVSRCTCPVQFSMIKVSEGKYRVGDSSALIFVRILRNHVMVRVGGGWDTLQHYLDKHDPCRCTSLLTSLASNRGSWQKLLHVVATLWPAFSPTCPTEQHVIMTHKQASKLASPQRTQVQHEITARLTPRTENPNKPQPALIVSRSQSPPPPVEWRPYVPLNLGPGRTLPASSPPGDGRTGGGGSGSSRRCPGLRSSQDPLEARRVRECSATPSQRAPAAEEKSGSQPTNATQSRRETSSSSSSSQQIRNMANGSPALKALPYPQRGRMVAAVQAATTPPKERTARLAPSAIAARRAVACQPPGSTQKEGKSAQPSRPPSPAQALGPSASQKAAAKTPVDSSVMLQERGGPERGGRRDPVAWRSSSPVKHMHQVRREDSSTRILGTVAPTSCRPLTPCRSGQGELRLRNGGLCLAKDSAFLPRERGLQGEIGPCEERRKTRFDPDALSDKPGLGTGQLDSRPQRKASQVLSGQDHVPRSTGGPGEPTREKERVYTPLPINSAEERALYQSLEEEIWSNIKELEVDNNHLPSPENQLGGFKTGKDALVVGCNGLSRLIPSLSSLQSGPKAVYGEGVPRSGVYVPDSAARWHSVGMHYDCVLQELSQTLHHQDCGETERNWPPLSSALVNGSQAEKEVLERGGSEEEHVGNGPEGAEPSPTSQGGPTEVRGNGDTSLGAVSAAANPPESAGVVEGATLPPSKPRRSLKKPERVPSIYKLKLRPKIRPRRDNRPEKRPSKIPTPVAYRHIQRASGGKVPAKAPNSRRRGQSCLRQSRRGGHIGGEGGEGMLSEHSIPSTQGGNSGEKTATVVGKPTELTDDEESWV